jgi:hypothetical protein
MYIDIYMISFEKPNYVFDKVEFNVDEPFGDHVKDPFPKASFFWIIVGKSGSGKTSILINSLTAKGKNRVYNKVFDKILLVMPSNSRKSIKSNPFDDLDEDQKFDSLNDNVFLKINEIKQEFEDDAEKRLTEGKPRKPRRQLLILDDITAHLKTEPLKLIELIANRRHVNLSVVLLVQYLRAIPLTVRCQVTHLTAFKPSNEKDIKIFEEEFVLLDKKVFNKIKQLVFINTHDFMMIDKTNETYFKDLQKIIIKKDIEK